MNWKLIWRGLKHPTMRNKILFILGILLVYRMLSHIPIPLTDPAELKQLLDNLLSSDGIPNLLSLYNVLSGGALASLSIMLVGLGPYITASITMQVLTKAIPKLETLQKEGEFGRKKINQYTRLLTLPLAIIQSVVMIFIVRTIVSQVSGLGDVIADATWSDWLLMITALTTGAMILMWLGELITEKGLGNGISLLITIAIVSQLPFLFSELYGSLTAAGNNLIISGWELPINKIALQFSLILLGLALLLTIFVVYLNEAHRKIKINYAKRVEGNRTYSDVSTFLPVKLIAAGVVPIIFALAFLTVPQLVGQFLADTDSQTLSSIGENLLLWFTTPGSNPGQAVFASWHNYIYPAAYFGLVVAFTYFYTSVVFSAKDISERLQRQGGFIEGVRPGLDTQKYLSKLVNRLNFFGSFSLGFLALTPILAQAFLGISYQESGVINVSTNLVLGGTSILILVAVALETLRQIESQALMVTYEDYEQNFNTRDSVNPKRQISKKKGKNKT